MLALRPEEPTPADPDGVCADARQARSVVEAGHETLRGIRRELVDVTRLVEAAARDADRHAVKDQKAALADAWRREMEGTTTDDARRDATAGWMRRISDINDRTRIATRQLTVGHQHVSRLEARLRSAELDAAALRIRAESLEAACAAARSRRASSDEQAVGTGGQERVAAAGASAGAGAALGGALAAIGGAGHAVAAAADGDPALRPPGHVARPVESETVRRLLSEDLATHQALASELAEMSGQLPARYLLLLDTLVDELTAAAVDAGELVFDQDHPLWGQFSTQDARLVVRGLRDLGFRLDIHEGWFGGRAPTGNDLASALGFAGHDVRALRGVPSAAQLRDLPRTVHVAAHDHLRRYAPDLTLDQMARALGPRAARLGDLWDEWGRVRPLLASGLPAPA